MIAVRRSFRADGVRSMQRLHESEDPRMQQLLEVEISDSEIKHRMAQWKAPKPRFGTGVFAKYSALVASASEGAITRP